MLKYEKPLPLLYSPQYSRINSHHTYLVDTEQYQSMRVITGTIKDYLYSVAPSLKKYSSQKLRRLSTLMSQSEKIANNPMLAVNNESAIIINPQLRLKSRRLHRTRILVNFYK